MMRRLLLLFAGLAILFTAVPALANGRRDYIPGLDPALRRQIQKVLKREGFYAGPIDGKIGAGSLDALSRFREARGVGPDAEGGEDMRDYLTPKLVKVMFGVDIVPENGEIAARQQIELMRRLGLVPTKRRRYVTD